MGIYGLYIVIYNTGDCLATQYDQFGSGVMI
jgi:hypothetical protein